MRILLVSNLFPPDVLGGYELLARDVAELLRSSGHDVHVLTTGRPRPSDPPWVHRRLELIRPFDQVGSLDRWRHVQHASRQRAAVRELLQLGAPFDVALVMSLRRLGMHVPRALAGAGIPPVFCFNDDWLLAHRPGAGHTRLRSLVWSALERGPLGARTWRGASVERAIYVSSALRTALLEGGAPVPAGRVVWQGVDRRLFRPRAFRQVPRAPRLLYTGRIHPTKGVDLAIEALAKLGLPHATLTIAGTGADEELRRLDALARRAGVSERVRFAGFIPREALPEVYQQHDVFVFPSLWEEPAGLTYLEAMSSGVPVVGLARGGARELMRDGDNCLVVEDAAGIAEAIRRLVEDPELAARIVGGGEETVERRASLARYVQAIEEELSRANRHAA